MQEKKPLITDTKVFIDFQIIKDSNPISLSKELDVLIASGKTVHIWSKTVSIADMINFSVKNNLSEYIWDYKSKDSFFYSSVDFIIDNNKKLVDRFIKNGKLGNYIERIE
jgi:hypothetical protein